MRQARKPNRNKTAGSLPRLWVAALVLLLPLSSSQAQDCLRVRQEVEATQGHLERAREVVRESGSPRAREPLLLAARLQEHAMRLLLEPSVANCARALDLSREARRLAERALRVAADQAALEQRALRELQQLERLLDDIRERAGMPLPDRLQRFLTMAQHRLEQAREAFHEQRFEEAMNMARDLRRLLEEFGNVAPMERLEVAFESTRRLLDNARDQVGDAGDAEALVMLERAELLLAQARNNLEAGHGPMAERQLRQARDLALRALRSIEGQPDVSQLDAVLEETSAYVEDVTRTLQEGATPEATTFIENAQRHLERARQLRREGKLRQALDEARVARNLARRASTLVDSPQ